MKFLRTTAFLSLVLSAFALTAAAQVTVSGSTGANGTYTELNLAFTAINGAGTQAGNNIQVAISGNTTETASAILNAGDWATLTVRPTATATVSGNITGAVIKLNGADNVTIDGRIGGMGTARSLTVQNTSTLTATAAIWLASVAAGNGASNNVLRNLEIAAGQTANTGTNVTIGVYMGGTTISLTSTDGNDNDNNQIIFNRIIRARYGIATRGVTTNNNIAPIVTDNIVGPESFGADEIGKVGIYMQADTNAVVSRNIVQYVGGDLANTTAGTDRCGICIGNENWGQTEATVITSGDYTVTRNIVRNIVEERTFSAVGIRLGTTRGGAATNNLVANNFIYNIRANGTVGDQACGIGYAAGHTDRIVFNSISMTGDMDPGTAANGTIYGNAMRVSTVNGANNVNLTMVNNSIFLDVNSNTAAVHFYAITLPAATYTFGTGSLNYNNYYFNAANPQLFTGGVGVTSGATPGTEFLTLANWQAALTPPQDANSIQANPLYFSPTVDLHIQGTSPNVNAGTAIAGITDDIDGQVRPNGANPDIGADEFYPSPGTVALSTAAQTVPETAGTVTVTVNRLSGANGAASVMYATGGGTATGGAMCSAGIDYVSTSGTLNWADLDAAPKTFTITICADGNLESTENFNVTLSNAMGATLGTPSVQVVTITDAGTNFTGSYNVGTGNPTTSLTNPGGIFEAINAGTVTGNVTINITSDLTGETGVIVLNEFAAPHTLTIKPSGAARVISGTSGANTGLIILNGADRVTIDGSLSGGTDRNLTINNLSTAGVGIWNRHASATNGSSNNTFKNLIIFGAPGPSSTTIAGILSSGTGFGTAGTAPNSNNTIQNNRIFRSQNSVFAIGGTTAPNFDQNWNISGNEFGSTVANDKNIFRGMLISNAQNFTISGNIINGVQSTTTTAAAMTGIQLAGLLDTGTVTNNRISDIKNVSATGTGAFGMQIGATSTASNVTIANNFIFDVAANGSATIANNGFGITFNGNTGGFNVYFNSINMNTNQATAQTSAAINLTAAVVTAGAINLRNNILSNTQTTGTRYAIYSAAAATVFSAIDYNDYFAQNVGFIGGSARPTLMDWRTATGQDVNSKDVDPLFVSPTDLHLQATSPMINMGVAGTGITTDIDGQTRDAMPDIGADEFVPAGGAGTLQFSAATYTVAENVMGGTVTLTVTRTGGSTGAVAVNYTLANGTATGGAMCGGAVDFVNTGGTVNFANGETSKTFTVTICNDTSPEPSETFTATLAGATGGATIGTPSTATVTITDDDTGGGGTFSINDVRITEGNTGTANLVFTVTYTGTGAGSVMFATANGTATAGSDYTTTTGTLNFMAAGTQNITVPITGDTLKEANEFFFVNLSGATGGTISDNQGAGIIVDNDRSYLTDFDRDLKADYSVFRPGNLVWYVLQSGNSMPNIGGAGAINGVAVPGDYDGDGKTDFAVFQASSGVWSVQRSATNTIQTTFWGTTGDKPVQGDYDGDGTTDIAIFRPSTGQWWIRRSSDSMTTVSTFGISTDRLVQGDYDGDAKTDLAIYRDGVWYVLRSATNTVSIQNWGNATDKPVSGDFDGDGRNDLAIYRNGVWWILNSLAGNSTVQSFGLATDIPAPADFDGDGSTDIAVYRGAGNWFVLRSSNQTVTGVNWGLASDVPVPAAYIPQ